jgi:long-chain fatty acid transport protein
LFTVAGPLHAGAFEFPWPSARAAGLGGACVAAIDPSAIACNPAGIAMLPKKKGMSAGLAVSGFNESLYQGLPPGIGSGTAAEQKTPMSITPHLYAALPFPLIGRNTVIGAGLSYPYRMHTEWKDPDQFAGRFLANESEVEAFDLTTVWSTRFSPALGIGAAVIYRSSSVTASRRIAATRAGVQKEVGSLSMKSDVERALGWSVGIILQPSAALSAGAAYHSAINTEYTGEGRLTQISTGDAQFDQLIKASLPFDQDLPVTTSLQFPSQTTFGAAWSPSKRWMFVLDASRTQWAKTSGIDVVFAGNHTLDTRYPLSFEDTWAYRTGLRFRFPTGPQLRFGYALDKSPQPDATVGPFLPDADRTTLTAGFGLDWLDLAVGWTTYKQRIVTTNAEQFNGNYRANSWIAMLTVTK